MKQSFGLLLLFFCIAFSPANKPIAMLGIKIHDSSRELQKIKLHVVAQEEGMTKYRTENGNDFSVTVESGKVVYMENDWLQAPAGKKPLSTNFTFGETSLRDVRKAFGTNGFTYLRRNGLRTETHLVQFNCFDVDSPQNEVLVVITKVPLDADVTEANVADKLKVDAIVLADKRYLEKLWGNEKASDKNYKKVKL